MRDFLNRFIRRAPKLADHVETKIAVDLRTGARSVERLAERVAAEAMANDDIKLRVENRANELVNEAIEGAARRAAEWRMRDIARRIGKDGPPVRDILEIVTEVTGVLATDLIGPRRPIKLSQARFLAYWLLKYCRPDLSLPAIGLALHRDHTSIMHGLAQFEKRQDEDPYKGWLDHPSVIGLLARRA